MGGAGHVQPRRRGRAAWTVIRHRESAVGDCRSTGQRNHDALKAVGQSDAGVGTIGQPQGITGDADRVDDAEGVGVRTRSRGDGRRQPAAHVGGDPPGRGGPPLLGGVRQPHRVPAVPRAQPPTRLDCATNRVVRQRPWLYVPRLYRTRVPQRGPPFDGRLGRRRTDRHHRRDAGLRPRQPPRHTRRLADPKTQRRPHRMDTSATAGHRPGPREQLPPPRAIPDSGRCRRR